MNIAILLTLMRVLMIPILVVVFYLPVSWSALVVTIIFVVAAITDWLDGYLARRLHQTSDFGAFLDPVADKLLVVVALVLIVEHYHYIWISLPAMIIIGRELVISALREWMANLGKRTDVAVALLGKIKTTFQMIAIPLLLFEQDLWGIDIMTLGLITLYIAAFLTLWSMLLYLRAALPLMLEK